MSGGKQIVFSPFTLDSTDHSLFRGCEKLLLRPKTLAVLGYLVEHPHRLIPKEELMAAAWPGAKVVNAALRVSIQEIREALGNKVGKPQFIETVGKKLTGRMRNIRARFWKQVAKKPTVHPSRSSGRTVRTLK